MTVELTKKMRDALGKLREECDYEDSHNGGTENYIARNKLAPGIGDVTLSRLMELGLIKSGPNRWTGSIGYRITAPGRAALSAALQEEPPRKAVSTKNKPKRLPPRIGDGKGRLDR